MAPEVPLCHGAFAHDFEPIVTWIGGNPAQQRHDTRLRALKPLKKLARLDEKGRSDPSLRVVSRRYICKIAQIGRRKWNLHAAAIEQPVALFAGTIACRQVHSRLP
jgi:hypothetical protein